MVLMTGAAGFIDFHLAKKLLDESYEVVGSESINDYYDPNLKLSRLGILQKYSNFVFHKVDLKDKLEIDRIYRIYKPECVINLAAQAGVTYSLQNPYAYVDSNLDGSVKHLIYASSSSVYGSNKKVPFSTKDDVNHTVSLYAATKKSNELLAHVYSHIYGIPTTGLRFFTVYGPWGRSDMAYFTFTKNIIDGKPIKLFNYGKMERGFAYIDDVVQAVFKLLDLIPKPSLERNEQTCDISSSLAPYKIYNIGNSDPVSLEQLVEILEEKIGEKAIKEYVEMQVGDVLRTYADVSDLKRDIDFRPNTPIEEGLERFVKWNKEYYNVKND